VRRPRKAGLLIARSGFSQLFTSLRKPEVGADLFNPQLKGRITASYAIILAENCLDLAKMSVLVLIAEPNFLAVGKEDQWHAKLIG
jgi:hypothetical protein